MRAADMNVMDELVKMSVEIGRPENDYVILGEGNTSADAGDGTFYVKASGAYLKDAAPETFVRVDKAKALAILDGPEISEESLKAGLKSSRTPGETRQPSIETIFHAYLLSLPEVRFVAHTHPVSVNSILFSVRAEEIVTSRLCLHEVVYCGVEPVYVPSAFPGLGIARLIRERVDAYIQKHGCAPKQIFLQNHGLIALGSNPGECLAITAMACKAARIILGANSLGGIQYTDLQGGEKIYE